MAERTGEISLIPVTASAAAVVRVRTTFSAWPRLWKPSLDRIWAAARAGAIPKPGLNVMIYRPLSGSHVDVECGVLIGDPFAGFGDIAASETPSGSAATCVHHGGYANLGASHAAVDRWCRSQGYPFAGVRWEIYGHWSDDPALVKTGIFHLTGTSVMR